MNDELIEQLQTLSHSIPADTETRTHPIGRFRVSIEIVRDNWKELIPLMSQMVVVECKSNFDTDTFDYVALSELFEMWPKYQEAPQYRIVAHKDNGVISFTAEKINQPPQ